MGSKDKELSSPEGSINPYENQRKKHIEENLAKMKAKGINLSLIGKTLLGKGAAAELSDEELEDSQPEVQRQRTGKKTLTQQGSMAEFVKAKSKERQQKATQSKTNDVQPKVSILAAAELPVPRELVSSQHELPREKDGKKTPTQQKENQSKHKDQQVQHQKKYCAPGTVTRYLTIQQQKTNKGTTNEGRSNEANLTIMRHQILANTNDIHEQPNDDHNLSNDEMDFEQSNDENTHQIAADAPDAAAGSENEAIEKKKHRGKTHLGDIHMRNLEQRDIIIFNNLCQPVGPTPAVVKKFNRFLGTLARNPTLTPLNVLSWRYMPAKDRIWEYVQSKYIVPEVAKEYVLGNIGIKWRDYKTKMKKVHFSEDATWEEMLAKRPKDVPECQFKELLEFWSTKEAQDMSQRNKDSREKQSDMHTMGPTTIALLREEMKQNDPEKRCPSQAELYIESRKRKVERTYLTPYDETLKNIEKMKELQSLGGDPYYEVIGEKEHSGRLRMYGHGVTQSSLKKKDPMKPYIVPSMLLDSIAAEVDQRVEERVAAEVDKRVEEKLAAEVDKRVEEKFASFLSKIRATNHGVDLLISDNAIDEGDASSSFQN